MTPGSLALLSATLTPEDRNRAIGAWAGLGGAAAAVGPLLGGYLVSALSWRWVFWINVPLAVAVVVLVVRFVPESADPARYRSPRTTTRGPRVPLDVPGAALGALGLGGVTYALIAAPTAPLSTGVAPPAVVGVAALVAFVARERTAAHPMVPPALFAAPAFRVVNVLTFFVYAALAVLLVFLVLTLQQQGGWSPAAAGSATLPFTAMLFVFSARVGGLADRIGARRLLTVGPLVVAVGMLLLTRVDASVRYVSDVLPGILLVGTGMTLTVAPLTATALSTAPVGTTGLASGINNAVARTAGLLAVAVAPLLVGLSGREYEQPAAVGRSFDRAMVFCALLAALGGLVAGLGLPGKQDPERHREGTPDQDHSRRL
jgi:predicted MFS family arabinose efflux permease